MTPKAAHSSWGEGEQSGTVASLSWLAALSDAHLIDTDEHPASELYPTMQLAR